MLANETTESKTTAGLGLTLDPDSAEHIEERRKRWMFAYGFTEAAELIQDMARYARVSQPFQRARAALQRRAEGKTDRALPCEQFLWAVTRPRR
jgi:hypothetical protein